jgi:hypothetical protein
LRNGSCSGTRQISASQSSNCRRWRPAHEAVSTVRSMHTLQAQPGPCAADADVRCEGVTPAHGKSGDAGTGLRTRIVVVIVRRCRPRNTGGRAMRSISSLQDAAVEPSNMPGMSSIFLDQRAPRHCSGDHELGLFRLVGRAFWLSARERTGSSRVRKLERFGSSAAYSSRLGLGIPRISQAWQPCCSLRQPVTSHPTSLSQLKMESSPPCTVTVTGRKPRCGRLLRLLVDSSGVMPLVYLVAAGEQRA